MNIYEKLAIIQQELKAPKNQYNDFGNYSYRSCEDILEGLKPCLQKVKAVVTISDDLVLVGDRYYIKATATIFDCEGEGSVSNTAYARETESRPKMDVSQITGSASSYARKYALNGLFCIDDVKDADSRNNQKDNEEQKKIDEKKAEAEKQQIATSKIDEVKQKALLARCEKEGVPAEKIHRLYKVSSFADISEIQFRNINDHWEDIKKVD